ncbi:MAG: sugar phosphate isomerase/epimerase [Spirochaetales bacterium]|jgi:sugar phosphate isomerase/epimerase|nr:sugar phosphate isomerase/epimerase [Spirochaetales bacterium]
MRKNDSPRPEERGIVVLQGMDCMRVHTPTNKALPGSKRPEERGMDPLANQLGIGSFAYRYHAGIPACMPSVPMTPMGFINAAAQLGLGRIQLCENLKYAGCAESCISALANRTKELGLVVEVGMNGITRENLRKHIGLARMFDSKFIRAVIGSLDESSESTAEAATENLKSVLDECRQYEIHIGIENHFDLTTPQIIQVIRSVNDPLIGTVFDSTNAVGFLEHPQETLALMLPYIKSVHLKDFRMIKTEAGITLTGQILGQGILDAESILKKVIAQNAEASIIIELTIRRQDGLSAEEAVEEEEKQIRQSVEYAKKLCARL